MAFRNEDILKSGEDVVSTVSAKELYKRYIPKNENCKPDYKEQAAGLKKQLDATIMLGKALENFFNTNNIGQFTEISSFAELVGGILITERVQQRAYDELLSKIRETK